MIAHITASPTILTGGCDGYGSHREDILGWEGEDWVEAGRMKMARSSHGVSTIQRDDQAMLYCN